MNNVLINIYETIRSANRYRDQIVIVVVHKSIFKNKDKMGNVIRDIYFLSRSGINVIVIYSNENIKTDLWIAEAWGSLEKAVFFDDIRDIGRHANIESISIVRCKNISDYSIADFAIDAGVKKIVYITESNGIFDKHNKAIKYMDTKFARNLIEEKVVSGNMLFVVEMAIFVCERSTQTRVHVISPQEGALLKEIFSAEGFGTMVCSGGYKGFRLGKKSDVYDTYEIINSFARKTSISFDYLHSNIERFIVYAIDEQPYGCSLVNNLSSKDLEVSYLCANDQSIMKDLLYNVLEGVPEDVERVFIDMDKSSIWLPLYPWLGQAGFIKCSHEEYCSPLKMGGNIYLKKI